MLHDALPVVAKAATRLLHARNIADTVGVVPGKNIGCNSNDKSGARLGEARRDVAHDLDVVVRLHVPNVHGQEADDADCNGPSRAHVDQ